MKLQFFMLCATNEKGDVYKSRKQDVICSVLFSQLSLKIVESVIHKRSGRPFRPLLLIHFMSLDFVGLPFICVLVKMFSSTQPCSNVWAV